MKKLFLTFAFLLTVTFSYSHNGEKFLKQQEIDQFTILTEDILVETNVISEGENDLSILDHNYVYCVVRNRTTYCCESEVYEDARNCAQAMATVERDER